MKFFLFAFLLSACGTVHTEPAISVEEATQLTLKERQKKDPNATLISAESGLKYILTQEGSGEKAGKGKNVQAHYIGTLPSGNVFDSSHKHGVPFEFTTGKGQVIKGWDLAFSDMKKGEKRILIIPPELGYGSRGGGPIPPNATLIFDVELVGF